VPDLSQFIKKDQNVQGDSSRFDFTSAKLEKEDSCNKGRINVDKSSTKNQKIVKVPFPRSNPAEEIHRTDMNQSESCIASWPALALTSQSELGAHLTSDQSEATRARPFCYKSHCQDQFVRPASLEADDITVDTTRETLSNSIDFIEDCARPPSSKFLKKVTSNLLWLVRSGRRILRRRIRPLHRQPQPSVYVSKFNNVELHRQSYTVFVFVACQQCRTPSTNCMSSPVLSNSISIRPRQFARLRVNNVELHRRDLVVPPFNNVELHRLSKLTHPVFSLEIAVELSDGELSSCAIH